MDILSIFFFSLLQALTEFLPISSSAHLFLLDYFSTLSSSKAFDVALHVGTVFAILVFFYKDILALFLQLPAFFKNPKGNKNNGNIIGAILISAIPAIIFGLCITILKLDDFLRIIPLVATNLIVFGVLLYVVDSKFKEYFTFNNITAKHGLFIGFAQALALMPGVSRSGACFTMARLLNISKQSAIKFSMLISVPVIFGAGLLELLKIDGSIPVMDFVLGGFVSFIFGLLVIKFLLFFIARFSFKVFMIYRVILGVVLLVAYFI